MFGLFRKSASSGPKERVLKTHDVEVRLYLRGEGSEKRSGKIWQSRWSDGTGKFSIQVRDVASGHDGKAVLKRNGEVIGEFPFEGRQFKFSWRGEVTPDKPVLEIGETITIMIGSQTFEGIVEPD